LDFARAPCQGLWAWGFFRSHPGSFSTMGESQLHQDT
jgi:hypothetical protein